MRYIVRHIRPGRDLPSLGMDNTLIREYASDRNALRYMHRHLRAEHFAPGQYELRTFPPSDFRPGADRLVGYLYKRA